MSDADLVVGQQVWVHYHLWTRDGWDPVRETATVIDPCVQDDPDYAGDVEVHIAGYLSRSFFSRASIEPFASDAIASVDVRTTAVAEGRGNYTPPAGGARRS